MRIIAQFEYMNLLLPENVSIDKSIEALVKMKLIDLTGAWDNVRVKVGRTPMLTLRIVQDDMVEYESAPADKQSI